jgi:trk system potassium uptake protein TrkH
MDLRPVFYVIGLLLSALSVCMVLPMLVDMRVGNEDWKVFLLCIFITAFFGGAMVLSNSGLEFKPTVRQAFLMTFFSWVALSIFSALPFHFSALGMSFTDSLFETVSGLTTTGSSVMISLDTSPPGLLIWRALLQWLGGLSLIIMALSVMPFLNIGGMQLFRSEISENDYALPRMARLSLSLGLIYFCLTIICAFAYALFGMTKFDALAHAMTTLSSGGFSTHDSSLGYYQSPQIEWTAVLFMFLGGLPFVLYLKTLQGHRRALIDDQQVRFYVSILVVSIATLTISLISKYGLSTQVALKNAAFSTVSLLTSTGFTTENYDLWGGYSVSALFFLIAIGACAGSTSGGIKLFRLQVFYTIIRVQLKKLIYPHGTFRALYNGRPIPTDVPLSVMSFLFLFAMSFVVITLALTATGLDTMTALSGAITTLSNTGPGMGNIIGPLGNFYALPMASKWILTFSMLLGRLEIMAVIVLLHPLFWKN